MAMQAGEVQELLKTIEGLQDQYENFLRKFMLEIGMRAIAQAKKITPVDTGNLRNRWELSNITKEGDILNIYLINPVEYASHVEYGHFYDTNEGKKYKAGVYMAKISIDKINKEIPERYEKSFRKFIKKLGG